VNRRQRRAAGQRRGVHPGVLAIADGYECPDCNADTELVQVSPGVHVLEVRHDDSCPWFNQRRTTP
jgi:hypothetical protein